MQIQLCASKLRDREISRVIFIFKGLLFWKSFFKTFMLRSVTVDQDSSWWGTMIPNQHGFNHCDVNLDNTCLLYVRSASLSFPESESYIMWWWWWSSEGCSFRPATHVLYLKRLKWVEAEEVDDGSFSWETLFHAAVDRCSSLQLLTSSPSQQKQKHNQR